MTNDEIIKVFVYGTLKPGEANYQRYCADYVVAAREAIALGQLFDLPFGYPAMTPGCFKVYGVLLSFANPEILQQVDWLEDYDPQRAIAENEYYRQQIEVYDTSLAPIDRAWTYLMTPEQVRAFGGVFLPDSWWSSHKSVTRDQ
ncbi:gamma-glutamylcyclotransferase family protein [Chroococcidiopsis sp.]|uniref:gamma-glutamylcyclotransferase family protein n=1 Tax=Chroococcidiopsis sp. TaxID=3088168 RepID=UPI003F3DF744